MSERETYVLSVTWGARPEQAISCAEKVVECLKRLEEHDPLFARWWIFPSIDWDAIQSMDQVNLTGPEIKQDRGEVLKHLRAGRFYTDLDHRPIEELGMHLHLINDENDASDQFTTLSLTCGRFGSHLNSCELRELRIQPGSGSKDQIQILKRILGDFIDIWEPDWGYLGSQMDTTDNIEAAADNDASVWTGWWTYLSAKYIVPTETLPVGRVESFKEGRLFVLTDDIYTIDNPEHLNLNRTLRYWLRHNLHKVQ